MGFSNGQNVHGFNSLGLDTEALLGPDFTVVKSHIHSVNYFCLSLPGPKHRRSLILDRGLTLFSVVPALCVGSRSRTPAMLLHPS